MKEKEPVSKKWHESILHRNKLWDKSDKSTLHRMGMELSKKLQVVKKSWNYPPYQSSKKNYQMDSNNNNLGKFNMITEKVINKP